MMPPEKNGRIVFVGNIPYDLTEPQLNDIFSSVGRVLNFRLVYDRDSGKGKGYGFAEYADPEVAASAVRNLNDHEVMGRKLRVDFSKEGGEDDAAPAGYVPRPPMPQNGSGLAPPMPPQMQQSSTLPPLPPGVDLPPNLSCPDAISRTLSTLPAPQLLDILSQMKGLVMADPAKATELLTKAPQLSYAIFQALLLMGLVDTNVLSSVVEQAVPAPQPTPQPVAVQPVVPPQQQAPYPAYLQAQLPPQIVATPPIQSQPYAPPPVQQPVQPPPVPQQQPPVGMDKAALIQQVLSLTQEQIAALPPAEQGQIILLRQQLLAGGGF